MEICQSDNCYNVGIKNKYDFYFCSRCSGSEDPVEEVAAVFEGKKVVLGGVLSGVVFDKAETNYINSLLTAANDGNAESIWNGRSAHHSTQPRSNFTVVYTRSNTGDLLVIGYGSHGKSNKEYKIFFDTGGSSKTCTRV